MNLTSCPNDSKADGKSSVIAPVCLFILGLYLLFLRNPDPFINPIIYAEDGTWYALALREGWLHALSNSRLDYFVFVNTALLFFASNISVIFSGNQLTLLPQSIAVISFSFFSGVATFAFLTTRKILSSALGVAAFAAVLLIPLGTTQNEIIGRILQVGFYMPAIAVLLLFWRGRISELHKVVLIDIFLFLCAATNPFVLAVCALYLSLVFLNTLSGSSIRYFFFRHISLILSLLALMYFLLPRMRGGGGGISGGFSAHNLVEALIARPIIYPFIFPWYQSLTNGVTIIGFLLLMAIVVVSYLKSRDSESRFFIIFLSLTIVFYSIATVVMRPGLTGILSDYKTTFPDRYFMGINILVVLLFVVSIGQLIKDKTLRFVGVALCVAFFGLYCYGWSYIFEWSSPKYKIVNYFDFHEQLCMGEPIDGTSNSVINIYPSPNWQMVVPSNYIKKSGCIYRSLSDAGLSDKNDIYTMQPSAQLNNMASIKIRTTVTHQDQGARLKRVGVMFGTYGRQNPGEAELRLNTVNGSSFIRRFPLLNIADNQYRFFDLDSKHYTEGEVVSISGGGISTWESHDGKGGGIYTCMIYEYVDGKRRGTPGCPL